MKLRLLILSVVLSLPVIVAAQSLDTAKIDEAMGRSGQKTGDVYRLGFPRTDLHVSIGGVEIKPGLALGSWAAFAGNDNDAMVMGDLVLLENELTPVMKKLRAAGFDISAVHNHVLSETPRVIYMHYMGHGKAVELAKSLLDISALEEHDIEVTALHSHMLTEQPRLFFMHFWSVGSTESVAAGIKAALSHVAVK